MRARNAPPQQAPPHVANVIGSNPDPLTETYQWRTDRPWRNSLHVGMDAAGWVLTPPQTSLLALGPARGNGKSSGSSVVNTITAPGPVVFVSTKLHEMAPSTAVARARLGELLHFSPTGDPTPAGFKRIRWSPIVGSKDPARALSMGKTLAHSLRGSGGDKEEHFKDKAGSLISAMLCYAANHDLDMEWVVDILNRQTIPELKKVGEWLDSNPRYRMLGAALQGISLTDHREAGSFFTTATRVLSGYYYPAALESAVEPDFDPDAFVQGRPDEPNRMMAPASGPLLAMGVRPNGPPGFYDTLYISGTSTSQDELAPIIIALLSEIRRATYAAQVARVVTLILDELYSMAAMPDLPKMLADGGSQGLLIVGCIQDLSQANDKWGRDIGAGFMSTFQNVSVLPGIRHSETLDLIESIAGKRDRTTSSSSWTSGTNYSVTHSLNHDRVEILPRSLITSGFPERPDLMVHLRHGGSWNWVSNTPYYRSTPWPQLLVSCMERLLEMGQGERPPPPMLMQDDDPTFLVRAGGRQLVDRYTASMRRWG